MKLSPKYQRFIRHRARVEWLEGTTAAGKTTVAALKFFIRVAESEQTQHILAGLDLGTVEKNIITKAHGILDELGSLVDYKGVGSAGNALPHIVFRPREGVERIVYVLGYADRARWKKALGGQYGCTMIDEVNVADIDFVRESVMRSDYVIGTLNPDDPRLPIYAEFINRAAPVDGGHPAEILSELKSEQPMWSHWFFSFEDNDALTPEKIERIKSNAPKGTKLYKNKILGLRGRATGLVFPTFDRSRHLISKNEVAALLDGDGERLVTFTSGLDTAYSSQSPDEIAMTFGGITDRGRFVLLDCKTFNNASLYVPLSPSDVVGLYTSFLERNKDEWGLARHCFIDSADQATITELRKHKRGNPSLLYIFEPSHKKLRNLDRIELQLAWMAGSDPSYIIVDTCEPYIAELESYSWDDGKDSTPEDGHDHCIQSAQYAWLPYRERIGRRHGSNSEDE